MGDMNTQLYVYRRLQTALVSGHSVTGQLDLCDLRTTLSAVVYFDRLRSVYKILMDAYKGLKRNRQ